MCVGNDLTSQLAQVKTKICGCVPALDGWFAVRLRLQRLIAEAESSNLRAASYEPSMRKVGALPETLKGVALP